MHRNPKNPTLDSGINGRIRGAKGFTLVELIVSVVIVAVLASIALAVSLKVRKKAQQTVALNALRQAAAANGQYAVENSGQINTLRWVGDPKEGKPYVGNSFWGRVQPYLFGQEELSNQKAMASLIKNNLETLFDTKNSDTMQGTWLDGSAIYHDGSGLPVPFAFNSELYKWNKWENAGRIGNTASIVYATYGFGLFDVQDGASYTPRPTNRSKPNNNIYYMDDKQAMVAFLDGHVEKLSAPIPERRFKRGE
jgi:prepilin-type N-terminal cleavage/methylation domain-containing protein/prepilin-type processing-associated H-X9-DG protein